MEGKDLEAEGGADGGRHLRLVSRGGRPVMTPLDTLLYHSFGPEFKQMLKDPAAAFRTVSEELTMLKAENKGFTSRSGVLALSQGPAVMTTPDVPRYTPTATPAEISTPTVPAMGADAFGAGLGEGLQRASSAVARIVNEGKEKADTAATIGAIGDLYEWKRQNLYDPAKGAFFKKGADAFNVDRQVDEDYKKWVAEKEQSLANDDQRIAFRRFAYSQGESIAHETASHVSRELDQYAKGRTEGALKNAFNLIGANPTEDNLQQVLPTIKGFIVADAAANKEPAELTDYRLKSAESQAHSLIVERLAVDNPVKAQEYFDQNVDKLLPAEAVKIKAQLQPLAEAQQGLQTANEVFYGADEKTTLADMLKKVHDKYPNSPNVVKHAEGEIRSLYTAREDVHKKEIEDAENAVYSAVVKVKLAGGVPSRSDVPPEAWAKLAAVAPDRVDKITTEILHDQEHAVDRTRAAQERAERKAEHDAAMADRAANKATPERVTTWAMLKLDPSTLAATNLDALYAKGKVNTTQYQDLVTDKLAIRQGKGERADEILSNKAAVDLVLQTVKIDAKKDPERYGKFYEALNGRMVAFERENNRRPRQAEVKDMARGLLGEVSQDRSFWFNKSVPAFEADPAKVIVPSADRTAITQALRSKKLPVTEDAIRKLYLEKTVRNGGR